MNESVSNQKLALVVCFRQHLRLVCMQDKDFPYSSSLTILPNVVVAFRSIDHPHNTVDAATKEIEWDRHLNEFKPPVVFI
jgi:hypothetical protein